MEFIELSASAYRSRLGPARAVAALALGWLGMPQVANAQQTPAPWRFAGADIHNSHAMLSPVGGQQLSPANVGRLKVKWHIDMPDMGDISATPTVEQGALYVTDWKGFIYKVDPETGKILRKTYTALYTNPKNPDFQSYSRNSPAIGDANEIVVGIKSNIGGVIVALNKGDLSLKWKTVVDTHQTTHILSSPVIYGGKVIVGVASGDEGYTTTPTFRGSVVALDEKDGHILWRFWTVPEGYTGGAIPGSSPAIDANTRTVFVGTGNNYSVPQTTADCITRAGTSLTQQLACLPKDNYIDAILALDLDTGQKKWARLMQGADTWTTACLSNGPTCPDPTGPDFDFASAPNLFWVKGMVASGKKDDYGHTAAHDLILGAGQKSSIYWALNPDTGGWFWRTLTGPNPIEWGSAVDLDTGKYAFVATSNTGHVPFTPVGRLGRTAPWSGGTWSAINALDGKIEWQVPSLGTDVVNGKKPTANGALSFTNYLVFGAYSSGILAATEMTTGGVVWSFPTNTSVVSSPAIFNDTLFWGIGYAVQGGVSGTPARLYAFSVDGK